MTGPDLWVTLQAPGATTRLLSTITEHGLVFIDGFHDPVQLLHLTGTFATVVHHRDSAADGITTIVDLRTSPRSGRARSPPTGWYPTPTAPASRTHPRCY